MIFVRNKNIDWNIPSLTGESGFFSDKWLSEIFATDDFYPFKYFNGGICCAWNKNPKYEITELNYVKFPKSVFKGIVCPIINFSEYDISDEDLNDIKCNELLDTIADLNGIVEVSSDKLFDYIKGRYPNVRISASYKKSIQEMELGKEIEYYNQLLDRFDRVELFPQYVKTKFMEEFDKINDLSRLEIIVNEQKIYNSPCAEAHNKFIDGDKKYRRKNHNITNFQELYNNSIALSIEEVEEIASKTGIRNFKIKGENIPIMEVCFLITNYVMNPFGFSSFISYKVLKEGNRNVNI